MRLNDAAPEGRKIPEILSPGLEIQNDSYPGLAGVLLNSKERPGTGKWIPLLFRGCCKTLECEGI